MTAICTLYTHKKYLTGDTRVLVVEGLFQHDFFSFPNRFEDERLAGIVPVGSHTKANLARVCVLVKRICLDKEDQGSVGRAIAILITSSLSLLHSHIMFMLMYETSDGVVPESYCY